MLSIWRWNRIQKLRWERIQCHLGEGVELGFLKMFPCPLPPSRCKIPVKAAPQVFRTSQNPKPDAVQHICSSKAPTKGVGCFPRQCAPRQAFLRAPEPQAGPTNQGCCCGGFPASKRLLTPLSPALNMHAEQRLLLWKHPVSSPANIPSSSSGTQ